PNSVASAITPFDPVWLNEIHAESSTNCVLDNFGEYDPWLELYNSGSAPISLDGYYLGTTVFLSENLTTNLLQWQFPAGTTIAPGEYKLIWTDGQPEQTDGTNIHTGFRLNYRGALALSRIISGQPQVTDYLRWTGLRANLSYGGYRDGQSVYRSL